VYNGLVTFLISTAENITFQISVDDGVKLIIDTTTVIDQWGNNNGNGVFTGAYNFLTGLYPVTLQYRQNLDNAFISLYWNKGQSGAPTYSLVPTLYSYYDATNILNAPSTTIIGVS